MAYFYKSAYEFNLSSGHNIFLMGTKNTGKTFFNRAVLGTLMNGYREAKEYLMGEDVFGAELFSVAHWVVDDGTMSTSVGAHKRWTEMIKRMAANKTFRYHEKFRSPMQVEWQGRVLSTLNADEESARLLPDLERSLMDKIMLFFATDVPTIDFRPEAEMKAILEKELPYFARFLLDWVTPAHCIQYRDNKTIDYRFGGVKPWHDPQLVASANQSTKSSGFYEILLDWMSEYFKLNNEGKSKEKQIWHWHGSAFQLRKDVCAASTAAADIIRGSDNTDISRNLAQLKSKGYRIESYDHEDIRYWTIYSKKAPKDYKFTPPTE